MKKDRDHLHLWRYRKRSGLFLFTVPLNIRICSTQKIKSKSNISFANENSSFIWCPQILHWQGQRTIPQCHLWFYSHLPFASPVLFSRLRVLVHLDTAGREAFNLYLESMLAFALCFSYFYKIFFGCLLCGCRQQKTHHQQVQQQHPITRSLLCSLLWHRGRSGTAPAALLRWRGGSQSAPFPTLPHLTSSFTAQPFPAVKSSAVPPQLARSFGQLTTLMKQQKNIQLFLQGVAFSHFSD